MYPFRFGKADGLVAGEVEGVPVVAATGDEATALIATSRLGSVVGAVVFNAAQINARLELEAIDSTDANARLLLRDRDALLERMASGLFLAGLRDITTGDLLHAFADPNPVHAVEELLQWQQTALTERGVQPAIVIPEGA